MTSRAEGIRAQMGIGNETRDRESAKPEGTREDGKNLSTGESSGKAGGSKRGPQEDREGGNDMRTSPRNSAGTTPKKTKVSDAHRKLAEIEKQIAEFKARLIEQMMTGEEEDPQGAGSREGRRTGQDEVRYGGKDNSHKGTPNKKGKDKDDPSAEGTENAMTSPAIDNDTSRLPTRPKVTAACDGLRSLRERVLGWFDPEGTLKTREKQRESKEGEETSAAGEAGSLEGGLKRIVATLTRALNKNQGYLADAKKKLTFDGANITEFLIDYENLAALLKWTEEEKMDHLGQHVSLSLGRDIMAIVASNGSWKKNRNEMMRIDLKAEKMATEAELAAVQRKNYATYNDFLRAFTLVALRIPGASPRLLKGLRQLLTRKRVKVEETPEPQEQGPEEAEAPQGVSNLQSIPGGLEDLKKAFANIRLNLTDREGGEVMRAPPDTKLNFHALPIGKLKVQVGTHHTDALVDGDAKITLIRRNFATTTGCTVNKEVAGSIREAGGEIPITGYVTKCAVRAGIRKSIWSFQRMTVMEEMDHDIILGRPWCANVEMIGRHLHDGTYMVDIEDPVTSRGELLRLLGTGRGPPKEGSVRKYKPVGKNAKPVSILVEISREEVMEKEEEILRVIRERRATEGHRIPDEVADTMQIGVEGFLTAEETQWIRKECQEFHLAFAFNDHQKGRLDTKLVPPVRIHTVEHECWNDKESAYEFGIAAEVTNMLRAKIDSFVVEPTASPYANKWFVFRKPNKTLRWIQDLQKLNAVTIRDAGSLPQVDLLAESHAGRSIYSLIDLYSGYDQLPLDARDRPYTAMHTPVGQLQMQVTPMGFTNAVAETQRRMLAVAGDMFPEKCEPSIDDNLVKCARYKDEAEVQPGEQKFVCDHLQDIKDLLQRFLVYNITASGPKSILAVLEVTILGFRCGAYGMKPDPTKTDKISQWPIPLRTTTEVRAFLGVVGLWRIFIKGFAKIVEPIRAMIREGDTME
ncbi:hypothetical protein CBR_g46789 [Chara braunii]|uniref:Reverse transcriptase domain-containing protein n=1 Tax=Chara braunii TaxID=69332 RepID=A0A388M163_CHABU|nr:hypothetical protein CBR_g46789 [Chara braunii]|eukprot:GBG88222.1 hypothetical protein CBR_g46789 [Chara braunii]